MYKPHPPKNRRTRNKKAAQEQTKLGKRVLGLTNAASVNKIPLQTEYSRTKQPKIWKKRMEGKKMPYPTQCMPYAAEKRRTEETRTWGKNSCGQEMPHQA
jgi:hypothetical protein